jgi:transposase
MMFAVNPKRVFLAAGSTDMRKSINGLSILVERALDLDPFAGDLFVFCNRRRNMIKILYWDNNGFALWHKRLEKHRFRWPTGPNGSYRWVRKSWNGFSPGWIIRTLMSNYVTVSPVDASFSKKINIYKSSML